MNRLRLAAMHYNRGLMPGPGLSIPLPMSYPGPL